MSYSSSYSVTQVFQRGKDHADKLKKLINLKSAAANNTETSTNAETSTNTETSTNSNIAATKSQELPCIFIPLLEVQKCKRLKKTEPEDLQEFASNVPYIQSVEELWRGRHVKISLVIKNLEA